MRVETEKTGGDLRQINQLDQRLWSGINAADTALSNGPGGTSCEAISIFLTRLPFDYLPSFFSVSISPGFFRSRCEWAVSRLTTEDVPERKAA